MKNKKLLAIILLSLSFCFVPALGYGEVKHGEYERKASSMDLKLLEAKVGYMMRSPTSFMNVDLFYDPIGAYGKSRLLPEGIDTEGKIFTLVVDHRGLFSYKSEIPLLERFRQSLEAIYWFIETVGLTTDMDTDIVVRFTRGVTPLGYFYQGEYHLWRE